jgi:CheY-like chemotaxis protein
VKETFMSALRKVLVVDDDPVVGRSFDRVLSGRGYIVVTAENGQEALDRFAKEEYDVVFTDIKMPGMSGLEVAEKVKDRRPWVPVVIVTGYGSEAHETRAEAAGVTAFLHKPLSPEMIEYSARMAVREKKAAPVTAVADAAENAAETALAIPIAGMGAETAATLPLLRKAGRIVRNVGLFFASPFIGLAYIILFPFVGLAMLAWFGARAIRRPADED